MCEMNVTVPVPATYTRVTGITSWLLLCTSDAFLHSHIVFTNYLGNKTRSKTFNYAFIQQQQKYNVFTWVDISITYVPKKMELITLYFEITCVYYILLDNRDLQSCQVGQG